MNPTDPELRPGQAPLPEDGAVVTAGPLTPPPDSAGTPADDRAYHHSLAEDVQGMVLATLVASLGLAVFAQGGLMIGGMAGVSFLLHYALGWNFGLLFVLVNLPFYWIAVRRMGGSSPSRPSWRWAPAACLPTCCRAGPDGRT